MNTNLRIFLIIFALFWFLLTTYFLKKNKLPVKYSLIWYFIIFIMIILGVFPNAIDLICDLCGFQAVSSFIIGIILTLMMLITLILTIIVANQKKLITKLIQEISLQKEVIGKMNDEKK